MLWNCFRFLWWGYNLCWIFKFNCIYYILDVVGALAILEYNGLVVPGTTGMVMDWFPFVDNCGPIQQK